MRRGARVELLGRATGIQWREVTGLTSLAPDSGWSQQEAARSHAVSALTIWLLVANAYANTAAELVAAVSREGGILETQYAESGVWLYRVGFTSPAPSGRPS